VEWTGSLWSRVCDLFTGFSLSWAIQWYTFSYRFLLFLVCSCVPSKRCKTFSRQEAVFLERNAGHRRPIFSPFRRVDRDLHSPRAPAEQGSILVYSKLDLFCSRLST